MSDPTTASTVAQWIPTISVMGGGLVTGITAFLINITNKKSEERKHLQTLIINAAIEEYKTYLDLAKLRAKEGRKVLALPLEAHIIHMAKVSELILSKTINKNNISKRLKEIKELMGYVYNHLNSIESDKKKK